MKKLYSLLSAALGIIVIIVSFLPDVRGALGKYAPIVTIVGLIFALCGILELVWSLRSRNKRAPKETDGIEDRPVREPPRYERKKTYITRAEYNFLQLLREIYPDRYEVIPQVALNSVIDKLTQNSYRNELFRVVDFLFVDRVTYAPLLLVELNDSSHLKTERMERDRKVNEICSAAGMPLVTFWTHEQNDFASIRKTVLKNILKK